MAPLLDDIMRRDREDPATLPLRAMLRCMSSLYGAGIGVRGMLYDRGLIEAVHIPCMVTSIGALAAGGTGKTPVTIMTARLLVESGCRLAVVSRGYGRDSRGIRIVSEGSGTILKPSESGDEPHLIAASLPGTPVVVGERRAEAAMFAWERFRPDMLILDDAFQHRKLARNTDVVTLDATRPFGNGFLLPRGTLREPPRALARADAVVFTRCTSETDREHLLREVGRFNGRAPVFFTVHEPSRLREIGTGEPVEKSAIKGMNVAALSNIADPESFHRTLESFGAVIVASFPMTDHHRHTREELAMMERSAESRKAGMIVMTAKDERGLPDGYAPSKIPAYVLDIETVLLGNREGYLDVLVRKIS
jgi:tetraacyldisaccharide 4'-kinase